MFADLGGVNTQPMERGPLANQALTRKQGGTMAVFARSTDNTLEDLQQQVQDKQDQLLEQFKSLSSGSSGGKKGRFWFGLLLGAVLGAAVAYLFDPEKGGERRQGIMGAAGSFGGDDDAAARDQAVNSRVEQALFSDTSVPKGQININTVDGVVYVRGTVDKQEQIAEIEKRIKGIEGVDAVINLLRLPTPAAR
jgi:gas vesicle protein